MSFFIKEDDSAKYRAEDKFWCTDNEMYVLQSRVKTILRPDENSDSNQGYKITSVYFDDGIDSHRNDTEEGVYARSKYRVRIYDDSFDVIKLEIKHKRGNRVHKISQQITIDELRRLMSGGTLTDEMPSMNSAITLFNRAIVERQLRPSIIVEYDRCAYVYGPGNTRVTFDRDVRCSHDFHGFLEGNSCNYSRIDELSHILELKYDEFVPGFILQMLETGNMQQISYSKYQLCREYEENRICQLVM